LAILGGAFGSGLKRNILDAMRGDSRSNGLRMATLEREYPLIATHVLDPGHDNAVSL
jgi:hypothetical protein